MSNEVLYEIVVQSSNKYKKQYQKDKQTIKSCDKLNRKSLKDNLIDVTES